MRWAFSLFATLFVSGIVYAKDVTEIVVRQTNLDEEIARVCNEYCQGNQRKGSLKKVEVFDIGNNSAVVKIYASLLNQHNTGPIFGIAFLITNDFALDVRDIVHKYARRWLVEQEIAEQILFFQLNHPSSSIVVKVDFDRTLSLLAHNLYRRLAQQLPGFEQCTVDTMNRKFLENGARVSIEGNTVTVHLKKKTHLPILFEVPWMKQTTRLSWMNLNIQYASGTVS